MVPTPNNQIMMPSSKKVKIGTVVHLVGSGRFHFFHNNYMSKYFIKNNLIVNVNNQSLPSPPNLLQNPQVQKSNVPLQSLYISSSNPQQNVTLSTQKISPSTLS